MSAEAISNHPATYGGNVTREPLPVTLGLLEAEKGLEVVLEGEVERLGREVSDDVGGVTTPKRGKTLLAVGSREALADTLIRRRQSSLLDPKGQASVTCPELCPRHKSRTRLTYISS